MCPQAAGREDRGACGQIGDRWPLRPRRRAFGRAEERGNSFEWPRSGHRSRLDRPIRRRWLGSQDGAGVAYRALEPNLSTSSTRAPPFPDMVRLVRPPSARSGQRGASRREWNRGWQPWRTWAGPTDSLPATFRGTSVEQRRAFGSQGAVRGTSSPNSKNMTNDPIIQNGNC